MREPLASRARVRARVSRTFLRFVRLLFVFTFVRALFMRVVAFEHAARIRVCARVARVRVCVGAIYVRARVPARAAHAPLVFPFVLASFVLVPVPVHARLVLVFISALFVFVRDFVRAMLVFACVRAPFVSTCRLCSCPCWRTRSSCSTWRAMALALASVYTLVCSRAGARTCSHSRVCRSPSPLRARRSRPLMIR